MAKPWNFVGIVGITSIARIVEWRTLKRRKRLMRRKASPRETRVTGRNCWNYRGKNFILIANIQRSRKARSVEFEETARRIQLDVEEKLGWNCKYSRWCVKARDEFQSLRDRTVGENQKYVAVRREILRNCASIAIFKNSRVNTR